MKRPSRYYVEYLINPAAEPEEWRSSTWNATDLNHAQRIAKTLHPHKLAQIRERRNIRDVTPSYEPIRGLIWDYDDELVSDD